MANYYNGLLTILALMYSVSGQVGESAALNLNLAH